MTNLRNNNRKIDVLFAEIEDNCIEHGIRGILKHSDIQRMLAEYDEDELQPRAFGKFQHLSGLVFKSWDRKIHVIEPFQIKDKEFLMYMALDTHPRNPDAVSYIAVNQKGIKIIVDEIYFAGKTSALVAKINAKDSLYRMSDQRLLEPAAYIKDHHKEDDEEESLADEFYNKYALDFTKASKVRARSDRRIKDALAFEKVGKEMISAPELYVFDTCTRTIYEFEHYQYDEWKGRTAEEKAPKEKPKDKDDHMIENIGRIMITEPVWTPPPAKTKLQRNQSKSNEGLDPYD